jgi:phospholipid-binding lipoprotein MlaA
MKLIITNFRLPLMAIVLLATSACTTLGNSNNSASQQSTDPLASLNRSVYAFNTTADKVLLRPVAQAYDSVLPGPVQQSVGQFFYNLSEPLNIVNNLLQGKVDGALNSTYRFAVNSTVGILGLFDVAKAYEVDRRPEDFGQTLAAWGVKPGPYLMLPFLGPSNLRDGLGRITDTAVYFPNNEISNSVTTRTALSALNLIDIRAGLLGADDILENQLDPYLFLKEAYDKNRLNAVYDGNVPEQSDDDIDF